jgi:hypothetical protein
MMIYCCDFHGCGNYKFYSECPTLIYDETGNIQGKHRKWKPTPHIHHYARSLEKFMLKTKTWETASSENSLGYSFYNYLDRTSGWEYDDSAVIWGCHVRAILKERTGVDNYVRPGDMWYRNPEYGKVVNDPMKRGRNGAAYGKKLGPREMNPYPPIDTYQRAHKPYTGTRRIRRRKLSEATANDHADANAHVDDDDEDDEDDDVDDDGGGHEGDDDPPPTIEAEPSHSHVEKYDTTSDKSFAAVAGRMRMIAKRVFSDDGDQLLPEELTSEKNLDADMDAEANTRTDSKSQTSTSGSKLLQEVKNIFQLKKNEKENEKENALLDELRRRLRIQQAR